jgi:aminoglycoside phosphotransferase (APT) family kinase protein
MDDEMRTWVEREVDGRVVDIQRPPGGGSREMYMVDVEKADGTLAPLVLRCEAGGSFTGTEISPAKEALIYRALAGTAVPVPRVIAIAPGGAALLMERVPGTGDISTRDEAGQAAVMESFVDALAALHNLDVDRLDLPGFRRPVTPEDNARLDLQMWAELADEGVSNLDPLARFSGAWLQANAPADVSRTVLVQGDTGPGNFVFDGDVVTGIVDWEFGHLGDPMDDWAWLDMRARGPVAEELRDRYTAQTGIDFDQGRIDYYRAAVDYRCAITTSLAVSRGGGARGWAPYLMVTARYLDALASRMAELLGVAETVDLPAVASTPQTSYFDSLLDGIRSAVKNLDDVEVREQTRNLQILVRYLRAHNQVGAEIEALDRADRLATMGPDSSNEERFAVMVDQAGRTGDETVFRYLVRRTAREHLLWASLLDR